MLFSFHLVLYVLVCAHLCNVMQFYSLCSCLCNHLHTENAELFFQHKEMLFLTLYRCTFPTHHIYWKLIISSCSV